MTPGERRLATLAALFAPSRAAALLARDAAAGAVRAVEHAARLAEAPRQERLNALAAAAETDAGAIRSSASVAAALERPRIAVLLRDLAEGKTPSASSALVRLCRERIGR